MLTKLSTILTSVAVVYAETIIMVPTDPIAAEQAAVIWIHGMTCDPSSYQQLAAEFQEQMQEDADAWIAIPEFPFDEPTPFSISDYVDQALKDLKAKGFIGNNVLMAGHSLGGGLAQNYANANSDKIKGLILMGSVLDRDTHEINENGETHFTFKVPTLTMAGDKDGLMRISRLAEAWYHQVENIEPAQSNMFPVYALEGANHWSFGSGEEPSTFMRDLNPEISELAAQSAFAQQMASFTKMIINPGTTKQYTEDDPTTEELLAPFIAGMKMEGFYGMKPPCFKKPLVNEEDVTCQHGSPWNNENTQRIMAGDLPENVSIHTDDNSHKVQDTNPIHLAQYNNTCPADGSTTCTLESITVSQAIYNDLDKQDTGYYPISASEIKTKIISRQASQIAAGVSDADFHTSDEEGNRCADINDAAIKWAKDNASKKALGRYEELGDQMVTGDDLGPYNAGPLWIWTLMDYTTDEETGTVTVSSPMMRTPYNYFVKAARGFHYCKVLSPFRVLEWIYVDSLFRRDGVKNNTVAKELNETIDSFNDFVDSIINLTEKVSADIFLS